jgi:hypothetical protein
MCSDAGVTRQQGAAAQRRRRAHRDGPARMAAARLRGDALVSQGGELLRALRHAFVATLELRLRERRRKKARERRERGGEPVLSVAPATHSVDKGHRVASEGRLERAGLQAAEEAELATASCEGERERGPRFRHEPSFLRSRRGSDRARRGRRGQQGSAGTGRDNRSPVCPAAHARAAHARTRGRAVVF